MAIFATNPQSATVTNSATKIFDSTSSNYVTGATLKDLTILNTGTTSVYLGQSTVTSSTGLLLQAGTQVTYNGYSHAKSDTTGDVYAITASGTSTTLAGLATVASND